MHPGSLTLGLALAAFLAPALLGVSIGATASAPLHHGQSEERGWPDGRQSHTVANRDRDTARQLYYRVMEEFRRKDYEAALAGFRFFMALHGKSPLAASAQYWVGECEFRLGRYQEAITAFSKAASVSKQSHKRAVATIKMALAYRKLGKDQAARVMLKRVLVEFPDTPEATVADKHLQRLLGQDSPIEEPESTGEQDES